MITRTHAVTRGNEISYEWTLEDLDEHGDIVDNDFDDSLSALVARNDATILNGDNPRRHLGLVRKIGNDEEGVLESAWAYVSENGLPAELLDSGGSIAASVPKRFHKELEKERRA